MGKRRKTKESFSFVITLISVSMIFIFLGFLMGQYALQYINQAPTASTQSSAQNTINNNQQHTPVSQPVSTPAPISASTPSPSEPVVVSQRSSGLYRVQTGAFSQLANAEELVVRLRNAGFEAVISSGPPYRVQTGAFSSRENAENYAKQLQEHGFEVSIIQP